jgi:cytochrome c oxidase subunit 3
LSLRSPGGLAHHFDDLEQQHTSDMLGMWVFLVTEVMFFGGVFCLYSIYRWWYPQGWAAGSGLLSIPVGAFNTVVLLGSSLTMALAVRSAQLGETRRIVQYLLGTLALGSAFLIVKAFEYWEKFEHHHVPGPHFHMDGPHAVHAQLFMSFYFFMTGLHALHMIVGVGLIAFFAVLARRGRYSPQYYSPIEVLGLYWHFVDIVWIFLFPLLYLVHGLAGEGGH